MDKHIINGREFAWLNTLQASLAAMRDWVAIAQLQALIDHIAEKHIEPDEVIHSCEVFFQ